jgi:hypothetical protein
VESLTHEDRNPNYPKDFFGENISNVTAIVGKNGSGKSSLMEALLNFTLGSGNGDRIIDTPLIYNTPSAFKTIMLYADNDDKLVLSGFSNLENKPTFFSNSCNNYTLNIKTKEYFIKKDDLYNFKDQLEKVNFIPSFLNILPCYYSNIFDEQKIILNTNREDIVTKKDNLHVNNPLRIDISLNNQIGRSIPLYYLEIIKKQAYFINKYITSETDLPFKLPPYLILKRNFNDKLLEKLLNNQSSDMDWLSDLVRKGEIEKPTEESDKIILYLWLKGTQNLGVDGNDKHILNEFIKSIPNSTSINWESLITNYVEKLTFISSPIFTRAPWVFDIKLYFEGVLEFVQNGYHKRANDIFRLQQISELIRMTKFMDCCEKIDFSNLYDYPFSFNEDLVGGTLSSGEKTFLKFGASIWNLTNKIETSYKDIMSNVLADNTNENKKELVPPENILIMLDEAELTLHPEWQKLFLNWSLKLIEVVCKDFKSVQVLYSSHSPFFLSDLPKGNAIFLKSKEGKDNRGNNINLCHVCTRDEQPEQTFGANIHNLYRNSFFLENGLMGEFAKKKIDDVIKDLNQDDPKDKIDEIRKKEMKFIIDQIGEPLIKRKLNQMYNDIFHSPEQIDNRIKALEEEIKQLKARNS